MVLCGLEPEAGVPAAEAVLPAASSVGAGGGYTLGSEG